MKNRNGFTLIELLVVIAIIALLMSILIPSLHTAKQIASRVACMSNQKQLGVAYIMAAADRDDQLLDAIPTTSGYVTVGGKNYDCFVAAPTDNTSLEGKIEGFKKGGLWPYLKTHKVFNCPFDRRWRKPFRNTSNIGGYRSYSIGAVLSRQPLTDTGEADHAITRYNQFSSPSTKFVFLEEADQDYYFNNWAWDMWVNDLRQWWDPFAIWHNGSSTFSYADGHAGKFKWTDKNMIEMSEGIAPIKIRLADTSSNDYDMIKQAYIPGRWRK
jgi:prepilin-type N-terminal cleavage/methylation domain-containing protein/prepilin-type processing-associated H-X9-DG protein